LAEIKFRDNGLMNKDEYAVFTARCEDVYNTLRKLRRESAGFLTKKDRELISDYIKNMRNYLTNEELFEYTKAFYDRK
jgi:hypothetical protein